jgi:undecaprenyl-diphosphatase
LDAIDRDVYDAVARQNTPSLDGALKRLSNTANRSVLWLLIAGLLSVIGGRPGRRAASRGLASIAVVSALVNLGLKSLHPRPRPDRGQSASAVERHVQMPTSSSFPSGHSASAFAFASSVGVELPVLALPLRALATAVAYSRVHTGVHYPSDTIAGALLGAGTGQLVAQGMDLWHR